MTDHQSMIVIQNDTPTAFVLVSEAARILKVTQQTVRLWERTGRLSATRASGGVRVFDRLEVEQLAAERAAAKVAR
jgi:excisionase family DNA binding protein